MIERIGRERISSTYYPEHYPERRGGRRLRIAPIAPPHMPLPPTGFGGSELVASVLTEELVRRSHAVDPLRPRRLYYQR